MNSVRRRLLGLLLLATILAATVAAFLPKPSGNPVRVTVFWSTDCPVALRYAARLHDFLRQAVENPSLEVTLHYPNDYETAEAIQKYGAEHKFPIPGSLDLDGSLARSYGLEVVPCIVVEGPSGEVVYSGPLDDSDDLSLVKTEYANLAIEAVLAGTKPKTRFVKPMGCTISRKHSRPESTALTWTRDIQPIIQRKCAPCHGPSPGSAIRLDRYADAVRWKTMIGMVVRKRSMPPFGRAPEPDNKSRFLFSRSKLSDSENDTLLDWLKGGLLYGDGEVRAQLSAAPTPQGVRFLSKTFVIQGGGARETLLLGSKVNPLIKEASGFRIAVDDPSFIRWVVLKRLRNGSSMTIGVWTMGEPLLWTLPRDAAIDFEPNDELAVEIHAYGSPSQAKRQIDIDLIPVSQKASWHLRSVVLRAKNRVLQPMEVKGVTLATRLLSDVPWLWIRPMSKRLQGTMSVRLDGHRQDQTQFHAQDWQPAYRIPLGTWASSVSIQAQLANKAIHGAFDSQPIEERLEVELAYLQASP